MPPNPVSGRVAADHGPEHEADGPLHGRTRARITLRDAAGRIEVKLVALPDLLYRITTPYRAGLAPQVEGPDGHPHIRLRPTGDDGPHIVTIYLNRTVRWDIRLPGGGEELLDLRAGRLTRLRLGGAGLVTLQLPTPRRPVPITVDDSIGTLTITTPPHTALTITTRNRHTVHVGRHTTHDRYTVAVKGTTAAIKLHNTEQ